ncbi:mCG147053 [Mus musculus]|nr:mCG147053 [Mus musculus]
MSEVSYQTPIKYFSSIWSKKQTNGPHFLDKETSKIQGQMCTSNFNVTKDWRLLALPLRPALDQPHANSRGYLQRLHCQLHL